MNETNENEIVDPTKIGKKERKNRRVMNTNNEIVERTSQINPLSLTGASALVFPERVSTTRSGMATKHATQRVAIANPEFDYVYTGAEDPFGERSSFNIKAKDDYKLIKTFRKFKDSPVSPVAYIFLNLRTNKYLCHLYEPAHNLVEKYGFKMNNCVTDNYFDGDVLPKGTPISQSSSYVNDHYCGGRNLRTLFVMLPELTEDALVISQDAADKMAYYLVDKIKVNIKKDAYLLNRYGNSQGLYKPFPNIGEDIQDGILCSIRENSFVSSRTEASIPHINDINYYSKGKIVDIDIYTNVEVEDDQFNYYRKQIQDWYSDIYSFISNIVQDPYQDDTSLTDIYHRAEKYLNDSLWCTKEDIVNTVIEFTVLQYKKIQVGQKVAGRYGNKSVITAIVPTEQMPRTFDNPDDPNEEGVPVDVLSSAKAVFDRIISYAEYEVTMTFMCERMLHHIRDMDKQNKSHDSIIELVSDFVTLFNKSEGKNILSLYKDNPDVVYNDILKNGIYLQIMPFAEECTRDGIIEAYDKYPDIMKRYHIKTKLRHRWINLPNTYSVGYMYTWVLKQEATKAMSSVATGRTTLYDLHVKTNKYKNHLLKYSANPIRFGEYDTYNFLAGVPVKAFAKLATWFRGSQYTEESMLASQLNDIGLDVSKYNNFPQISNLKNILKFMGIELTANKYNYNTIGCFDEVDDIMFNNISVQLSIPDLRFILITFSYYLQFKEYNNGIIDLDEFFNNMRKTTVFNYVPIDYREYILNKFVELLPVIKQLKIYE